MVTVSTDFHENGRRKILEVEDRQAKLSSSYTFRVVVTTYNTKDTRRLAVVRSERRSTTGRSHHLKFVLSRLNRMVVKCDGLKLTKNQESNQRATRRLCQTCSRQVLEVSEGSGPGQEGRVILHLSKGRNSTSTSDIR